MMFLLDTNVLSELRKLGDSKAAPPVVAWLSKIDSSRCFMIPRTPMNRVLAWW